MATVEDVRRISMALPEAEEILTWGEHPAFRVRGRIFVIAGENPDRASIKATPDVQADLIDLDPEAFGLASHVGRYGWVEVTLERVDPEMIRPLIVEAWRMTAPKRLWGPTAAPGAGEVGGDGRRSKPPGTG